MRATTRYYKHSGSVGPMGPVYMGLAGGAAALLLGGAYGYAIFYIPFIYLNVIITLLFGGVVGFVVGWGAKQGKVRNNAVALAFGLGVGLLAEYVGWVSWIHALTDQQVLAVLPAELIEIIGVVAEDGVWSLRSWTPTGAVLYGFWLIEAVLIVGASTFVALGSIAAEPFCERCSRWADNTHVTPRLEGLQSPDAAKAKLEVGDMSELSALQQMAPEANEFSLIELKHCAGCHGSNFLTLKSAKISHDKDGKASVEEADVLCNLVISEEQRVALAARW